jgi:hypothetical protein
LLTTSDTPSEESIPYIEAGHILDVINPLKCIFCTHDKATPGVNTTCNAWDTRVANDAPLRFLHEKTLELYNFWMAISKKTIFSHFHITACSPDHNMVFYCNLGTPGVKQALPVPEKQTLEWIKNGELRQIKIGEDALKLLEEALLTHMQCGDVIGLMTQLMQKEFLDALK